MTEVACLVRQSQGTDDSISLQQQREDTRDLAAELGDPEPEMIDFGNRTGFSTFMKDGTADSLDLEPQAQELEGQLQNGEWDYLVAYDDKRVARDQYFWVLKYYAKVGGVEFRFVDDLPSDRLTFRIQRAVSSEMKAREIQRTRKAVERRLEQGMYQGTAPFGLTFDDAGEYLVRDPDEWPALVEIFRGIDGSRTYAEIVADVGGLETKSAISKIKQRRETYEEFGLSEELCQ